MKNNISVIGAGYVGLVTGACLSSLGNNVILVDKNKKKINEINNGKDPINEPNLKNVITLYPWYPIEKILFSCLTIWSDNEIEGLWCWCFRKNSFLKIDL